MLQTEEEREDTKEGIRIRIRRRTNYNITTIITIKRQTLFIKLMIEQQDIH